MLLHRHGASDAIHLHSTVVDAAHRGSFRSKSCCSRTKAGSAPKPAPPRCAETRTCFSGALTGCDRHLQFKVYTAVPAGDDGADMADLKAALGDDVVKIGMGAAMKNKVLTTRKRAPVLWHGL